jgi:hypothetical protein
LIAPEIDIPEQYEAHWRIYFDVSNSITRVVDGLCFKIAPSEWLAWSQLTGVKVEYEMMRMMDDAYVEAMNQEIAEYRERTKPT